MKTIGSLIQYLQDNYDADAPCASRLWLAEDVFYGLAEAGETDVVPEGCYDYYEFENEHAEAFYVFVKVIAPLVLAVADKYGVSENSDFVNFYYTECNENYFKQEVNEARVEYLVKANPDYNIEEAKVMVSLIGGN